MLTLVLGGARSGKSAVAERLAASLPAPVTYVATGVVDPGDADFAARVDVHRARRPASWATVEVGGALVDGLAGLEGTLLVDSLGTWVAAHRDRAPDVAGLVQALAQRSEHTVVVSDEVGLGVHPSTEPGRRFRDTLGTANAALAEVADRVLFVVAGR
ncbi:MAG: bifunctional adenosylcobinamide kinase/adenosylcobinamide-phosphate guanylyltransferase, partial [Acidimicrobiales bacterium]|nr:bifunctional adenosylcobinamide kinase/adenosylcobinamide-phosphate guanylyltransferase [Acidimicrobiales bacterium]